MVIPAYLARALDNERAAKKADKKAILPWRAMRVDKKAVKVDKKAAKAKKALKAMKVDKKAAKKVDNEAMKVMKAMMVDKKAMKVEKKVDKKVAKKAMATPDAYDLSCEPCPQFRGHCGTTLCASLPKRCA